MQQSCSNSTTFHIVKGPVQLLSERRENVSETLIDDYVALVTMRRILSLVENDNRSYRALVVLDKTCYRIQVCSRNDIADSEEFLNPSTGPMLPV